MSTHGDIEIPDITILLMAVILSFLYTSGILSPVLDSSFLRCSICFHNEDNMVKVTFLDQDTMKVANLHLMVRLACDLLSKV